jgi:hypothetical protein
VVNVVIVPDIVTTPVELTMPVIVAEPVIPAPVSVIPTEREYDSDGVKVSVVVPFVAVAVWLIVFVGNAASTCAFSVAVGRYVWVII